MMRLDSVEYHRATVLGRGDDHEGLALGYYASRGETPLEWGGSVAGRLGLEGAVDEADYDAIYENGGARDPHLGERLVVTRRPGIELVVAAHKSVAVLGIIGLAEHMHAILDAETDATLAFLDTWFARQGGGPGKAQRRTHTTGLLWARTRHATSRAGDPAPHDHVLIANLTEMLDDRGGWKALDTAGFRDLVHAATLAGRLAAAEKAVELGYAITPDHGPLGQARPLGHCRHPRSRHRAVLKAVDPDRHRPRVDRLPLAPRPAHRRLQQPRPQERRVTRVPNRQVARRAARHRLADPQDQPSPRPRQQAPAPAAAPPH
ncbi:MAG: relaxase domain-containing protein [Actinobacteria bacterium]|nr:relaxase domain-containing protein [Actinomycetota bacterium]